MNEIVNKFLLAGDNFMPEMHLRQPGPTYSACGTLQKTRKKNKNLKKQEIHVIFIKMNQIKLVFNMTWLMEILDLTRRTVSDKILRDKAFNIAKNPKYDRYQRGLASMVYKFFDKKASGSGIKNESISDKELAEELYKPIIRKITQRKVYSFFTDNM